MNALSVDETLVREFSAPANAEFDAQLRAFDAKLSTLCGGQLPWLRSVRLAAMERFLAVGFPSQRQEAWKYTNSAVFARRIQQHATGSQQTVGSESVLPESSFKTAYDFVFVDGHCVSVPDDLPAGLALQSLAQLLSNDHAELRSALVSNDHGTDAFSLLNTANFSDGIYLHVDPNVEVTTPIHLRYFTTASDSAVVQHVRNIIRLGANSRVTVVESYYTLGKGANLTNVVTDIALESHAQLEHAKLQCEAVESLHVGQLKIDQASESQFRSHSLTLGSQTARSEWDIELTGEGAEVLVNGLYMGSGRQHLDQFLQIRHAEPKTRSEQYFYGVLDGRAQGIFKGLVAVAAQAQQTDARQVNRNLLLSEHAEVATQPQLQIQANDVKCSHGATVGQLSEDALFYLRSRGIDASHARALLTRAFAWEVLNQVHDPRLHELFEQVIIDNLPETANLATDVTT